MAVTTNTQSIAAGIVNFSTGQLVTDGNAAAALVLSLGFAARKFKLTQVSGTGTPSTNEWNEGMANGVALLGVAAGTLTITTTLGPTVTDRTLTIPAGALPISSSFVWEAWG